MAQPTTVKDPLAQRVTVWIGFPIAGALVVFLLERLADWIAGLEWAPFQGLFRLVSKIPEPWDVIGAAGAGLLLGLFIALIAHTESLLVEVGDTEAKLTTDGRTRVFPRETVTAVCLSGKDLVLFGPGTTELARDNTDADPGALAAAFASHGYTWLPSGDPYADDFRRWVDDPSVLPEGANGLLKAREKALSKDDRKDAAELREELARLGVAVRDEKKKQYWRKTTGA
ncbi:hypothetical protein Afil01_34080 [Actinorhabdospora filicis]|uniref:DUF308 domain-containing protein n=1 Tax=Actinorhabdospora filicis TaxID=1785913 RepID=A0A9W6SMK2_9ACTN|nr:hypothetical protein [Actinorhabdospora filicis]GLZ78601.1 hypothetical protein Afil01_34080 [Actinorhabdospora filicis]